MPLINEQKKKHGWRASVGRYKNSGQVRLALCNLVHRSTMLQYISGGCEINLMVAVDYTGSNGQPSSRSSLHYIHKDGSRWNDYQAAIHACGTILLPGSGRSGCGSAKIDD